MNYVWSKSVWMHMKRGHLKNQQATITKHVVKWKADKNFQLQAYFQHCSFQEEEKKTSTWIKCVCAHSGGIYTGCVFIYVHNEADL